MLNCWEVCQDFSLCELLGETPLLAGENGLANVIGNKSGSFRRKAYIHVEAAAEQGTALLVASGANPWTG